MFRNWWKNNRKSSEVQRASAMCAAFWSFCVSAWNKPKRILGVAGKIPRQHSYGQWFCCQKYKQTEYTQLEAAPLIIDSMKAVTKLPKRGGQRVLWLDQGSPNTLIFDQKGGDEFAFHFFPPFSSFLSYVMAETRKVKASEKQVTTSSSKGHPAVSLVCLETSLFLILIIISPCFAQYEEMIKGKRSKSLKGETYVLIARY